MPPEAVSCSMWSSPFSDSEDGSFSERQPQPTMEAHIHGRSNCGLSRVTCGWWRLVLARWNRFVFCLSSFACWKRKWEFHTI